MTSPEICSQKKIHFPFPLTPTHTYNLSHPYTVVMVLHYNLTNYVTMETVTSFHSLADSDLSYVYNMLFPRLQLNCDTAFPITELITGILYMIVGYSVTLMVIKELYDYQPCINI